SEFPEVKISRKSMNIMELLIEAGMAPSKAEARRLVEQGGVKIDGKARRDWQETVDIKKGAVIQVGKRRFVKII
ncbi:MAG: S4 domain-containing protein, partial [Candidatus Pacebacteria bacterium]|nr:S4 domain-containing protein [Candidatus Paceibacterota bacterium]